MNLELYNEKGNARRNKSMGCSKEFFNSIIVLESKFCNLPDNIILQLQILQNVSNYNNIVTYMTFF